MLMSLSERSVAVEPTTVVSGWIDAFNARDLEALLACLAPDVELQPLKLTGLDGRYEGRAGARGWFEGLRSLGFAHVLEVAQVRETADGQVLAIGAVVVPGEGEISRFCGLHVVANGLIHLAHHYFSDPDMLEHLGRFSGNAFPIGGLPAL